MNDLSQMTTEEARSAFDTARIAVLPIGATEQHGHHLAVRTDTEIAYRFAAEITAGLGESAVLCPTIPYGLSEHHVDFPGTLTLRPQTLRAILLDLAESIRQQGVDRIIVVNGHGGNIDAIRLAAREARRDLGVEMAHVMWAPLAQDEIRAVIEPGELHNHACEIETSLALHLDPSLVRAEPVDDTRPPPTHHLVAPPAGPIDLPQSFETFTTSGSLGHPSRATAELGEHLADTVLRRALDFARWFAARP
jgi:creatinine amidohydrolase